MRSANGVGLFVIQSSHQVCRLPMLIAVVFVIAVGGAGLALGAAAPMFGAVETLGLALGVGSGGCDGAARARAVRGLGEADTLGRGDIEGEADGRAAGGGNTGGSTRGVSMRRSTVRANPSDNARSSSASVAPNVARRRRCVTFALSFASGEIQSTLPASFGAAMPLMGGCGATAGRTSTGGRVAV